MLVLLRCSRGSMRDARGRGGNSGTAAASQPNSRSSGRAVRAGTGWTGVMRSSLIAIARVVRVVGCVWLQRSRRLARAAQHIADRSRTAHFRNQPAASRPTVRPAASASAGHAVCTPCSRSTTCAGSRRDTDPQRCLLSQDSSSRSRRRCRPRARCCWPPMPGPRPTTLPQAHSRTSRRCTAEPSAPTCPACRCCSRSAARAHRAGRPPRGRSSIPRPTSRRHSRRETTPAPQGAHPQPRCRTQTSRQRKATDRVGSTRAPATGRAAPLRLRTRAQPTAAVQAVLADLVARRIGHVTCLVQTRPFPAKPPPGATRSTPQRRRATSARPRLPRIIFPRPRSTSNSSNSSAKGACSSATKVCRPHPHHRQGLPVRRGPSPPGRPCRPCVVAARPEADLRPMVTGPRRRWGCAPMLSRAASPPRPRRRRLLRRSTSKCSSRSSSSSAASSAQARTALLRPLWRAWAPRL